MKTLTLVCLALWAGGGIAQIIAYEPLEHEDPNLEIADMLASWFRMIGGFTAFYWVSRL